MSEQEQLYLDLHDFHRQWAEAREGSNPGIWRRSIMGARGVWRELERQGVVRDVILRRQLSTGMRPGEGRHWNPFWWHPNYFLTTSAARRLHPPTPNNRAPANAHRGQKRKSGEDELARVVKIARTLNESCSMLKHMAKEEHDDDEDDRRNSNSNRIKW